MLKGQSFRKEYMHGAVHDFIVVHTVKEGKEYPSAEEQFGGPVKNYITYDFPELQEQPIYKKMLDIGSLDICGSVAAYNFINRRKPWREIIGNPEIIGIDIMGGNGVDQIMDAHNLQFPDESFDLVTCCNMLEHDTDTKKTIKEAYRVLQKGGTFILTTVNQDWGEHKHLGGGETEVYNHITKAQLTKWLKDGGFKKAEVLEWNKNLMVFVKK